MSTMIRRVALVAAIVSGLTLAVATGAVPLGPGDQLFSDEQGGDNFVTAFPGEGEHGNYSYYDQNGEFVIDLSDGNPYVEGDGVNENGVTYLSEVFYLEYDGDDAAHVWIELAQETAAVSFMVDGESIMSEETNVTLTEGEVVPIGMRIDTREDTAAVGLLDLDSIIISATIPESPIETADDDAGGATGGPQASSDDDDEDTDADEANETDSETETAYNVSVDTSENNTRTIAVRNATTGERVTVPLDSMELGNVTLDEIAFDSPVDSNETGYELILTGDENPIDDRELTVEETGATPVGYIGVEHPFETDEIPVEMNFSVAQTYLNDTNVTADQVTLYQFGSWTEVQTTATASDETRERFTANTSRFDIYAVATRVPVFDVAVDDVGTVTAGDDVTVNAEITNLGTAVGSGAFEVRTDGEPLATETVSVDANETVPASIELTAVESGIHVVYFDDVVVSVFTVDEPPAESDEEPAEPAEEAGGFGLFEGLGLVLLLSLIGTTIILGRKAYK